MKSSRQQKNGPVSFSILTMLEVLAVAVFAGLLFTHSGINQWDDEYALRHSNWVMNQFGLASGELTLDNSRGDWAMTKLYGPIWELALGIGTQYVFASLDDPLWVRHSLNAALCMFAVFVLYMLLRRAGLSKGEGALGAASMFGIIRLGGHALMNTRDAPAAVVFTCVTVGLWILLKADEEKNRDKIQSLRTPILLGMVSVLPFLTRVPLLIHPIIIAVLYLGLLALRWNTPQRKVVFIRGLLVAAAMIITIAALYPLAWELSAWELLTKVASLPAQDFHWDHLSLFGKTYESRNMPWWYALFWTPIIIQPFVLIAVAVGMAFLLFRPKTVGDPLHITLPQKKVSVSLAHWLWVTIALSWTSFILVQANLYDAERQILFLYPNLLLLGILGLSWLKEQWKQGIALLLFLTSIYAYATWGRYSYIYINSFLPVTQSDMQGDYWGLCMPQAVNVLPDILPKGTIVQVSEPMITAETQVERLTKPGSSTFDPDFEYTLSEEWPAEYGVRHFAVITNLSYRSYVAYRVRDALDAGIARVIWSHQVPSGDTICSVVLVDIPSPPETETSEDTPIDSAP